MNSMELDMKIGAFLQRKDAKYPSIGLIGHNETRTVKFPSPNRIPHATH